MADLRLLRGRHREGERKGTIISNLDQGVQEKRIKEHRNPEREIKRNE